jgi:hypothetical protein
MQVLEEFTQTFDFDGLSFGPLVVLQSTPRPASDPCRAVLCCAALRPVCMQVLEEFTQTFDFDGLSFDAGLRIFLESFKLPGEAQKIDRIINCE